MTDGNKTNFMDSAAVSALLILTIHSMIAVGEGKFGPSQEGLAACTTAAAEVDQMVGGVQQIKTRQF